MFRFSTAIVTALMFVALPLAAQDAAKSANPKPLDDLNTVSEIEAALQTYHQNLSKEIQALTVGGKEQITPEKIAPYLEKAGNYTAACGERMLKIAKGDAEKTIGYRTLVQGLQMQDQSEKVKQLNKLMEAEGLSKEDQQNPEKMAKFLPKLQSIETAAAKKLESLYEEIEKSGNFTELLAQRKLRQFAEKAMALQAEFTLEKFEQLKTEAFAEINNAGKQYIQFLLQVAESPEANAVEPKLHEKTVQSVTAYLQSDKCTLPKEQKEELADSFVAEQRLSQGADLNLYGKTIDNKDFDWKSLKAKYILVKFTATWCGPCKGEIPGMLEAYKKYHDKGLEIVSVYCWEHDKPVETVKEMVKEEKIPWIIVSEFLTEKSGGKPQGKFYGVKGVPTMLIVDQSGKVIATDTRGKQLQDKLAELFK